MRVRVSPSAPFLGGMQDPFLRNRLQKKFSQAYRNMGKLDSRSRRYGYWCRLMMRLQAQLHPGSTWHTGAEFVRSGVVLVPYTPFTSVPYQSRYAQRWQGIEVHEHQGNGKTVVKFI